MNENNQQNSATWGLTGTMLWAVLIAVAFVVTQTIAAVIYLTVSQNISDPAEFEQNQSLFMDGDVITVSLWVTFVVCGFLVLVAIVSKAGSNIKHYLALKPISWRIATAAVVVTVLFILLIEVINAVFNRTVPDNMVQMFLTADNRLWFWLAIVVAAPVFEEVFFRGFLHSGLERTNLGLSGTILFTAAFWAVIHFQYDAFEVGLIFVLGVLLGIARWVTGSLYVPIIIHCVNNLISTVQLSYFADVDKLALPSLILFF